MSYNSCSHVGCTSQHCRFGQPRTNWWGSGPRPLTAREAEREWIEASQHPSYWSSKN